MISAYIIATTLMGQSLWAKTYGGISWDESWSVAQTTDGGFAIVGATKSFGAGDYDLLLFKVNTDGSPVWARTFGGNNYEGGFCVKQVSDGGYVVVGSTESFGAGNNDVLILKVNSSGSLIWAKTLGDQLSEYAYSIVQTQDGGYALAGWTDSYSFMIDFLVVKLSSDGSLAWAKTYGEITRTDEAFSIIQTADGGYAVAGRGNGYAGGDYDVLVLKLNPDGSLEWGKMLGGPASDEGYSIIQTVDEGFMVVGATLSFGAGEYDLLILKLNSDGSLAWAKTYGGTHYDGAWSIIQNADGTYAVAGYTESSGIGGRSFLLLRITPDGSLEWARKFGGLGFDEAHSVVQTPDGNYVIAGYTDSFGAGWYDLLVLMVNSDGSYPGCVQECEPTVMDIVPNISSLNVGTDCSPSISSPSIASTTPTLSVTDVCLPLNPEEVSNPSRPEIVYSPTPGGALFFLNEETIINIYSSDGRVVYARRLQKGENKLTLEPGVYFWKAGNQKGKAVVK
ncbi:MAG: hypothetical protein ABIM74_04375 [candidate division WOR-3 bacterium]